MDNPSLSPTQLEHFRRDATPGGAREFKRLAKLICDLAGGTGSKIRIADFGGGDGRVLDACLDTMPEAEGVLVDVAEEMIDVNRPRPNKQVFLSDLRDVNSVLPEGLKFDVILFNVVLHHCIERSVSRSRALQQKILEAAARRLRPGGRLFVLEQIHESFILPDLPSLLIFGLTRSRGLGPLIRGVGGNTGGVGVLFASERRLLRLFRESKLTLQTQVLFRQDGSNWRQLAVGCTNARQVLFVLLPDHGNQDGGR